MVNKKERVIDVVKDNAVWINSIAKEKITAESWEKKWGFYIDDQPAKEKTLLPQIHDKFLVSPVSSKLPPGLTDDPNSLVSAYLTTYNIKLLKKYHYPTEKYMMPPTTQSEIGWTNVAWLEKSQLMPYGQRKLTDQRPTNYCIDRFKYSRGKGSVFKWWGGGPDALKRIR